MTRPTPPVALTLAGSDPSGGAGLQADLKTFHQHGVYGAGVVTLLTVQNTRGVAAVHLLDPQFVADQFDAVVDDIPPQAVKIGALGNARAIAAVARCVARLACPVVVDPVMISKHGHPLLDPPAAAALAERLLPLATVVTPNRAEAARLAGVDPRELADRRSLPAVAQLLAALGPRCVLLKGGVEGGEAADLWWSADGAAPAAGGAADGAPRAAWLVEPAVATPHVHGAGCVLAAALTARLAGGATPAAAARGAKRFVTDALRAAPGLGRGIGPLGMHVPCR